MPLEEASGFGIMEVDDQSRVVDFVEKPEQPCPMPDDPDHALASMGMYVFNSDYLRQTLKRDAALENSSHDFGKDILPHAVATGDHVLALPLERASPGRPYWRDVGTIDSFFQANLALLDDEPVMDMHDPSWPIYTRLVQFPPARYTNHHQDDGCRLIDSLVSNGCVVTDSVLEKSLLSNECSVARHCELRRVVALPGCEIGPDCRLENVLLDNGCIVPEGTVIGEDLEVDARHFHVTSGGVIVVNRDMLGQERRYQPLERAHKSSG